MLKCFAFAITVGVATTLGLAWATETPVPNPVADSYRQCQLDRAHHDVAVASQAVKVAEARALANPNLAPLGEWAIAAKERAAYDAKLVLAERAFDRAAEHNEAARRLEAKARVTSERAASALGPRNR